MSTTKEISHFVETPVGTSIDNVGGPSDFTRCGRLFSLQTLRNDKEAEAGVKAKGKQVVVDTEYTPEDDPKITFDNKVEEFMRIIKKSDYKIVDQLNQTPSKISIMSLLMSSGAHRVALLNVLNIAYVPHEIIVNQLEGVILNVNVSHGLRITNRDLTADGRNYNKAFHITLQCKGEILSHVLVDTGSSLNVLPKKALMKIEVDGLILRPSDLVVRAFDGSQCSMFGEVELPI